MKKMQALDFICFVGKVHFSVGPFFYHSTKGRTHGLALVPFLKGTEAKLWFFRGALRPIKAASEAMALVAFVYSKPLKWREKEGERK